jgi:hypothetical protein
MRIFLCLISFLLLFRISSLCSFFASLLPLSCSVGLANSYFQLLDYSQSEHYYELLYRLYQLHYNQEHPKILELINSLTNVKELLKKYKEAEQLCDSSLSNCVKVLGKDHPITQQATATLAKVKLNSGNLIEAEDMYRKAIIYSEKGLGETHPQTISLKYSLVKLLINHKKEYNESEKFLLEIIAGQETNQGEYAKDTLDMYQYLGELYLLKLSVLSARIAITKAYNGRKATVGIMNPTTYYSLFYIGKSYHLECSWRNQANYFENVQKTETILKEAYEGIKELLGFSYPLVIEIALYYGNFLLQYDRFQEAELIYSALFHYYSTSVLDVDELLRELRPSLPSIHSSPSSSSVPRKLFTSTAKVVSPDTRRNSERRKSGQKGRFPAVSVEDLLQFGEIAYKLGVIHEKLRKMNSAMSIFEKSYYLFMKAEDTYYKENGGRRKDPVKATVQGKLLTNNNVSDNPYDSFKKKLKELEEEEQFTSQRRKEVSLHSLNSNSTELLEKILSLKKESYEQFKHAEYINKL